MRRLLKAAGLAGILAAAGGAASCQTGQGEIEPFVDVRSGNPDGRAVVLIPGLASSGEVWAETASALPDHDVHTLTLAGFAGVPPREDGAPVIAGAADAVAAMLEAEDLRDVALVGHSLGGMVAVQAALRAAGRVSQVVVVDSAPFYAGLTIPGVSAEEAREFAEAAGAQMAGMSRESFDIQQAAGMERYSKDPDFVRTLVEWSEASDMETVIQGFAEVAGGDFRQDIAEVSAPILVLVAWDPAMGVRKDLYETLWKTQYAAAPDAEVILIEDSYHFIMHDQREAFIGAVTEFLESGQ